MRANQDVPKIHRQTKAVTGRFSSEVSCADCAQACPERLFVAKLLFFTRHPFRTANGSASVPQREQEIAQHQPEMSFHFNIQTHCLRWL